MTHNHTTVHVKVRNKIDLFSFSFLLIHYVRDKKSRSIFSQSYWLTLKNNFMFPTKIAHSVILPKYYDDECHKITIIIVIC